jgi:hypothetical protein
MGPQNGGRYSEVIINSGLLGTMFFFALFAGKIIIVPLHPVIKDVVIFSRFELKSNYKQKNTLLIENDTASRWQ